MRRKCSLSLGQDGCRGQRVKSQMAKVPPEYFQRPEFYPLLFPVSLQLCTDLEIIVFVSVLFSQKHVLATKNFAHKTTANNSDF